VGLEVSDAREDRALIELLNLAVNELHLCARFLQGAERVQQGRAREGVERTIVPVAGSLAFRRDAEPTLPIARYVLVGRAGRLENHDPR
jgi:hypothetical protein